MSLLIRGMEMPRKQVCVILNPNGLVEVLGVNNVLLEEYQVIPVPPHGRLGDLDELKVKIKKEDNAYGFDSYGDGIHDAFQLAYECIDNAPTIIPAEEGE